jgi:AraC-like DNA-binding protein
MPDSDQEMDPLETINLLKVGSLDELNQLSNDMGWDAKYSRLAGGPFSGHFQEGVSEKIIVSSETISVPITIKVGGIPGYVALSMCLSNAPIKVNGADLTPDSFLVAMPSAGLPGTDLKFISQGAVEIHVALVPEAMLEQQLGESYYTLKNTLQSSQVVGAARIEDPQIFVSWFQYWSYNASYHDELERKLLADRLFDIVIDSLDHISESFESTPVKDGKILRHSKPSIDLLIEYFYANPERVLSAEDMSAITGLSRRNLFYAFKQYTGYTPYQFGKFIRLDFLHRELQAGNDDITSLAMKYSFNNLGDFSAIYKNTYGELPSETKRKFTFVAIDI